MNVDSIVRQYADELNTLAFYVTGNSVESFGLVKSAIQQFVMKYDSIPADSEPRVMLTQSVLRNPRFRSAPKPQSDILASSPRVEPNLFDQLMKQPSQISKQPAFQQALRKIVLRLDTELRIPLLLADKFGFSYEQIGKILGQSMSSIGFRMTQARDQVICALRGEYAIPV